MTGTIWLFSNILRQLNIKDLEKRLKQGKLTFASDQRLKKYLGVEPGSVSPFGLINDTEKHVHLFIDEKLNEFDRLHFSSEYKYCLARSIQI